MFPLLEPIELLTIYFTDFREFSLLFLSNGAHEVLHFLYLFLSFRLGNERRAYISLVLSVATIVLAIVNFLLMLGGSIHLGWYATDPWSFADIVYAFLAVVVFITAGFVVFIDGTDG
jgi:hypothetical protein